MATGVLDTAFDVDDLVNVDPKPWMKEYEFTLVQDIDQLRDIIDEAIEHDLCAVDLETQGLDNRIDSSGKTVHNIVGYCLCYDGHNGIYVPVLHKDGQKNHPANLNSLKVSREIKRLCENCTTVYHNSGFDLEFLYGSPARIQIDDPEDFEDTYILSYLGDPTQKRHGLKKLSKDLLGKEMIELEEIFVGDTSNLNFQKVSPEHEATLWYAGSDAICTFELYHELKGNAKDMQKLYWVEKATVPAHRWMERNRPRLDRQYLENLTGQMKKVIESVQDDLYRHLAGVLDISYNKIRNNPEFDVSSPQKLGNLLQKIKDDTAYDFELQETPTGKVATNEEAIDALINEHGDKFPFLDKISTFRNLQKVLSTYVKPLLEEGADWDGAIKDHTARFKFNPYGTDSGRFSAAGGRTDHGYSGVNIQSMPGCYNGATFQVKQVFNRPEGKGDPEADLFDDYIYARDDQGVVRHEYDEHFIQDLRHGDEYCLRKSCEGCPFQDECEHGVPEKKRFLSLGAAARPAVVAREGYVLVAIDYAGMEMRVAAEIADEENWKEEFIHGEGDGHKQTAKIIYGDDVVKRPDFKMYRQNAKAANFAVLYGGGGGAIANSAGIPDDEGWDILRKMKKGIPSFRQWEEETISAAHRNEEVRTCLNRRIPLPDINHEENWIRKKNERKATNSIIQGSATGDAIKYSMASVYRAVRDQGYMNEVNMLFAIHDELVFEVKKDTLEETIPLIREKMTEFSDKMGWDVPIEVDIEFGEVWDTQDVWSKMKDVQKSGVTKQEVPGYLQDHLDWKRGMWLTDDTGRKIYDGSKFIPSDSEDFDWGMMHEFWDKRKIMKRPVPEDWKNHVSFSQPGMWWKGKNGVKFWDGEAFHSDYNQYLEVIEETLEGTMSDENSDAEREDEASDTATEKETETEDQEEVKKEKSDYPVYTYKAKINLNNDNGKYYVFRLRNVIKFMELYARENGETLTHRLEVQSPRGRSILPEGKQFLVHPKIFEVLAKYEGL